MHLTAATFTQVLQSLRSDALAKTGQKEHRQAPRVGVRSRATIVIPQKCGTKPLQVMLRDLSVGGIGLLSGEPILAKDEPFVLLLPDADPSASRLILYSVRRVGRLSPNQYSIGAVYDREITPAELGAMVKASAPPAAPARPAPVAAANAPRPAPAPAAPPRRAPAPPAEPPIVFPLQTQSPAKPAESDAELLERLRRAVLT